MDLAAKPLLGDERVILSDSLAGFSFKSVSFKPQPSDLHHRRLRQLYGFAEHMGGTVDIPVLLRELLDIVSAALHVERMVIALRNRGTNTLEVRAVRNSTPRSELRIFISKTIINHVLQSGEGVVIADTSLYPGFARMSEQGVKSVIASPVRYRDKTIGLLYADRLSSTATWATNDLDFLTALGQMLAIGLLNNQLQSEFHDKRQLENDIQLARQIQEQLFPRKLPQDDRLRFEALNVPGRQISGDYFDVVPITQDKIGVVIADVSGKGASAAILMANLQAAIRMNLPLATDLSAFARQLNQHFCLNCEGRHFITGIVGVVDLQDRQFRYVNAGHFPPCQIVTGKNLREFPVASSLPLGILPEEDYPVTNMPLGDAGCSLLLYTDGVPEAVNEREEPFGTARLLQTLANLVAVPPADIPARFMSVHRGFVGKAPQGDDITLLAIHLRSK